MAVGDKGPRVSLADKVFRNSLMMAILGIGITLFLSYELYTGYYQKAIERDLVESARQAIRTVDTGIYIGLLHARYLAQLDLIHALLKGPHPADERRAAIGLEPYLTARVWHVTVLDLQGRVVATTRTMAGSPPGIAMWWTRVIEWGAWVGEPYQDTADGIPLLPVAVLVEHTEAGGPAGVVRVELNWQNVVDALANVRSAFHVAFAFVANSRGRLHLYPDPAMIGKSLGQIGGAQLLAAISSHDTGVVHISLPDPHTGRPQSLITGFAHSSGTYEYPAKLDWWAGVACREGDVLRDAYARMLLAITLTALVAALLILGVLLSTRRLFAPLADITERMSRFGAGETDRRLDVQTGDELEVLATTFNAMADGLRHSHESLEAKIHELFTANERLKELARLKGYLVASVSHELRTPLHSIIAFTELTVSALRGKTPRIQIENLERVRRNAYNLMEIINQINDFSKLESGTLSPHLEDVDLTAEMTSCLDLIAPLAAPGVQLQGKDLPALTIRSDGQMIRQVLVNLLSNAVKFTSVGHVTLSAREVGHRVEISVEDTGIGIEEQNLGIIFEEFRQVDGSAQRVHSGTGLGLAIVKQMVHVLGGEIRVRSQFGVGSTFTVDLPRAAPLADSSVPHVRRRRIDDAP